MPGYRRVFVPGGTYFFTVALEARGGDLLVREIASLRAAIRRTRAERPFRVEAMVVLPDHLHCVWTMPAGDRDFPTRWGAIKARFTRAVKAGGGPKEGWGGTPPCACLVAIWWVSPTLRLL
jgi:putative transposase